MTTLEAEIRKLPRLQKISLMEQIWDDLSHDAEDFALPEWHGEELLATERALSEGKEHFEDWLEVKKRLCHR